MHAVGTLLSRLVDRSDVSDPRSRRSLLRTVGAASLSVPLAGCSVLDDGPDGVVLGDLVVRNATPDPRTVRLELSRDGERVHEGTHTVEGASDDVGAVTAVDATWSSDPAVYELTYVVRESEQLDVVTEPITADAVGTDRACAVPTLTVGFPREEGVVLEVLGTEQYCPGAQTTSERS